MFVEAFQNGLRTRHFNESLTQRFGSSLDEVVTCAEFYIKGKEKILKIRSKYEIVYLYY